MNTATRADYRALLEGIGALYEGENLARFAPGILKTFRPLGFATKLRQGTRMDTDMVGEATIPIQTAYRP